MPSLRSIFELPPVQPALHRVAVFVAWGVVILAGAALPAAADGRVALVIGNGHYRFVHALQNPPNDAGAIADSLRGVGFDVSLHLDLDRLAMSAAMREFGKKAVGADVAVVFYAGHGIQLPRNAGSMSENYLVPVDARLTDVRDADDELIALDRLLEWLNEAAARVVILDACRENPDAGRMQGLGKTREISRGLARIETRSRGTLLVFSTEPGAVALDGGGDAHSPFAAALLKHLPSPGIDVRQMLTHVRAEVNTATHDGQTPWSNDGLMQDIVLVPASGQAAPDSGETDFWNSLKDSTDPDEFDAYLARYPGGRFVDLARLRLHRLRPPAPPSPAVQPASAPAAGNTVTKAAAPAHASAAVSSSVAAAAPAAARPRASAAPTAVASPHPPERRAGPSCGDLLDQISFDRSSRPAGVDPQRWRACGGA